MLVCGGVEFVCCQRLVGVCGAPVREGVCYPAGPGRAPRRSVKLVAHGHCGGNRIFYLAIRGVGNHRGGELGTHTQGWRQALNAFTIAFPGRIDITNY